MDRLLPRWASMIIVLAIAALIGFALGVLAIVLSVHAYSDRPEPFDQDRSSVSGQDVRKAS